MTNSKKKDDDDNDQQHQQQQKGGNIIKQKKKKKKSTTTSNTTNKNNNKKFSLNEMFIGLFGIGFLLSVSLNFISMKQQDDIIQIMIMNKEEEEQQKSNNNIGRTNKNKNKNKKQKLIDHHQHNNIVGKSMKDFKELYYNKQKQKRNNNNNKNDNNNDKDFNLRQMISHNTHHHPNNNNNDNNDSELEFHHIEDPVLGTLNCEKYGGPSIDDAKEMIYWSDIPSDATYRSPFHILSSGTTTKQHNNNNKHKQQQQHKRLYLTFEPDGGGWNNIRMAMESVIGLAIATGRTLVMPPQKKMYLLGKGDNRQQNHFSFIDFFPIEDIANEHIGLDIISMEDFLLQEAMTGNLINKETKLVSFPPNNRTNWDGSNGKTWDELRFWLRTVTITPMWKPNQCLPTFPSSGNHKDIEYLQTMATKIQNENSKRNIIYPIPVNSTVHDRLIETLAGRTELCVYNETLQNEFVIHFQCNHKLKLRMLVHFYAFLFFENWLEDLWMKRFIRDHVRYIDEIQCAAGRIVTKLRQISKENDPNNIFNGTFDTFHIRRGDFQYKNTRISAEDIIKNTKNILKLNSTIFIATDERDKSFFKPFTKDYNIYFLDDFITTNTNKRNKKGSTPQQSSKYGHLNLLHNVNSNYYGMIDQLIASKGNNFFGCFFSTFTGYITRLRGYYSQLYKLNGYEMGILPTSYYYVLPRHKYLLHNYVPIGSGFFSREYPISWRNINTGIGML